MGGRKKEGRAARQREQHVQRHGGPRAFRPARRSISPRCHGWEGTKGWWVRLTTAPCPRSELGVVRLEAPACPAQSQWRSGASRASGEVSDTPQQLLSPGLGLALGRRLGPVERAGACFLTLRKI